MAFRRRGRALAVSDPVHRHADTNRGLHSPIHLRNFYSIFWPGLATAHITVLDAGGHQGVTTPDPSVVRLAVLGTL